MDFLALLKDIVSIVVVANAVTGQAPRDLDENYVNVLKTILTTDDNRNSR